MNTASDIQHQSRILSFEMGERISEEEVDDLVRRFDEIGVLGCWKIDGAVVVRWTLDSLGGNLKAVAEAVCAWQGAWEQRVLA